MKHKLHFTKMHGLGNDFIVIDAINQRVETLDFTYLAALLCDRHLGIGGDGVILVLESETADLKMRIFNADGSEPEMCGNGIRCFAKFAYENTLIEKEVFSVETLAGNIVPALVIKSGRVEAIEVDMGEPILARQRIPMSGSPIDQVVREPLQVGPLGTTYEITCVSMGNPHAVVFVDDLSQIDLTDIGPHFEQHPVFPQRINTEFVEVASRSEASLKVWERGSGETLACGTGACATLVAGVLADKLDRKALIHLPGGDLFIEWQSSNNHVIMTGPAMTVFAGEIDIADPQ